MEKSLNFKMIFIAVIIGAVLVGVLYYIPIRTSAPGAGAPRTEKDLPLETYIIKMTAEGFVPNDLVVPLGSRVRFVNEDDREHWPASGEHPTHEICPGFDAPEAVPPGGSYEHQFDYPPLFGNTTLCPMHDHPNPELKGTISLIKNSTP